MDKVWWTSSCGRIELEMTPEQVKTAYHSGQCDDDVRALSEEPDIAAQLATIQPDILAGELRGYGAWDDAELADHAQNLQRVLWTAAADLFEKLP